MPRSKCPPEKPAYARFHETGESSSDSEEETGTPGQDSQHMVDFPTYCEEKEMELDRVREQQEMERMAGYAIIAATQYALARERAQEAGVPDHPFPSTSRGEVEGTAFTVYRRTPAPGGVGREVDLGQVRGSQPYWGRRRVPEETRQPRLAAIRAKLKIRELYRKKSV